MQRSDSDRTASLQVGQTLSRAKGPSAILLAAALLLPLTSSAQIVCALGPNVSAYKPASDQRPSADAMQLAGRVNAALKTICAANCPQTVIFRNTTAPNAMLAAAAGQAKLVYAPQFFSAAYDAGGDGAILGLMAHELGHALDDTMGAVWVKSDWPPELRADAWAGCTLAKIDLSAADLQASLSALAKYPAASSPGWKQRMPVLRTGFTQCGGAPGKFDAAAAHIASGSDILQATPIRRGPGSYKYRVKCERRGPAEEVTRRAFLSGVFGAAIAMGRFRVRERSAVACQ